MIGVIFYPQQAFAFFGMVSFGLLAGIILFVIITGHNTSQPRGSDPSDYKEDASNWAEVLHIELSLLKNN